LRHFTARLGATAACLRTLLHHLIIAESLTILCTPLTDIGANATCLAVKLRHTQHEVSASLADSSTVKQQLDMTRLGVITAHLQTMSYRLRAAIVTIVTLLNTGAHLFVHHRMRFSVHFHPFLLS
jgi:hypothetical protein